MRVSAERDGPDYTGRVIIDFEPGVFDCITDFQGSRLRLPAGPAAEMFGGLGDVLQEIEANTDPP